ncbi:MAG: gluconate 2-dehydrogenase subunit 3 family protein [Bacteroidota bacterium]
MDRRTLLKQLGVMASGAMLLPSCDFTPEKIPIALNNLKVSLEQEALLAELVGAIIPTGEIPGAKDLEVQNFVWVMADDCMEKEDQNIFINGLNQFMRYVDKFSEISLEEITPEQQVKLLNEIMEIKSANKPVAELSAEDDPKETPPPEAFIGDIQFFINQAKNYTIRGYLQSEYVMRELMPYSLVPGGYNYCETIDPNKKVNIHG